VSRAEFSSCGRTFQWLTGSEPTQEYLSSKSDSRINLLFAGIRYSRIQTPGLGSLFRGDTPAAHVGQCCLLAPDLARLASGTRRRSVAPASCLVPSKSFESERLYERLGALVIKRYVPTGGDLVMRRLRRHHPERREEEPFWVITEVAKDFENPTPVAVSPCAGRTIF
jgi:hypothetical protein